MKQFIHRETREIISLEQGEKMAVKEISAVLAPEGDQTAEPNTSEVISYLIGAGYVPYTKPICTVNVYSKPNCMQCKAVRQMLDINHIKYNYIEDIDTLLEVSSDTSINEAPIIQFYFEGDDINYLSYSEFLRRQSDLYKYVKSESEVWK